MDRWQAQNEFWSSFTYEDEEGETVYIEAYDESSVPDDAELPYITYQAQAGPFETILNVTASVWTRSQYWDMADKIADEIESRIKSMGCPEIDGGRYRVYIGETAFAQNMGDPTDDMIKRKVLNVNFEFMTI